MVVTYGKAKDSDYSDSLVEALPIGVGDTKVDLPPGRHPKLPAIYRTEKHPLYDGPGRIFYFIHDGSFKASRKTYECEVTELKIPQGPREEAVKMGTHICVSDCRIYQYMRVQ